MVKRNNYSAKINTISNVIIKNKIIIFCSIFLFLLRFPILFEPLMNNREAYLITYSSGLLPKEATLMFLDLPAVAFIKTAFLLFGKNIWSIKFLLSIYFIIGFLLAALILKRFFSEKYFTVTIFSFTLLFGLPYFGTNQINFSLYLPAIIIGLLLLIKQTRTFSKFNPQFLLVLPILAGLALMFLINSPLKPNYYPAFIAYSFANLTEGSTATEKYFESFGNDIQQSYSLAYFIKGKTSSKDYIFVAGNQSSIYFLAERRAASVKILSEQFNDVDEILTDIEVQKPAIILRDLNSRKLEELDRLLNKSYNLTAQENNVKIYFRKPI